MMEHRYCRFLASTCVIPSLHDVRLDPSGHDHRPSEQVRRWPGDRASSRRCCPDCGPTSRPHIPFQTSRVCQYSDSAVASSGRLPAVATSARKQSTARCGRYPSQRSRPKPREAALLSRPFQGGAQRPRADDSICEVPVHRLAGEVVPGGVLGIPTYSGYELIDKDEIAGASSCYAQCQRHDPVDHFGERQPCGCHHSRIPAV